MVGGVRFSIARILLKFDAEYTYDLARKSRWKTICVFLSGVIGIAKGSKSYKGIYSL